MQADNAGFNKSEAAAAAAAAADNYTSGNNGAAVINNNDNNYNSNINSDVKVHSPPSGGLCCSRKCNLIIGLAIGSGLTLAGLTLLIAFPFAFHNLISNQLPIVNGSTTFTAWQSPPAPISMQFWIFHLINADEFLAGDKPALQQMGPFTYTESRDKYNISFHSNSTVQYRERRQFVFNRKLSCCDENASVTMVNLAYFTVAYLVKNQNKFIQSLVDDVFKATKAGPIKQLTAQQLIWGYTDPSLNVIAKVAKLAHLDVNPFIGLFAGKNNSDDGLYNVFTGSGDVNKLAVIDRWQGDNKLNYWTTDEANTINGSDGTLFHPFMSKNERVYIFSSDICRSIYLEYTGESTIAGISLLKFTVPAEVFLNSTLNPANAGFCLDNVCTDSGVLNMSTCQPGPPGLTSQPHFYQAADKYQSAVTGLQPSPELATELNIEPNTGVVMSAAKKLQVNLIIESYPGFKETERIKSCAMPLIWINESAVIDAGTADQFKQQVLMPLFIVNITQWLLFSIGSIVLLACIAFIAIRGCNAAGGQAPYRALGE